MPSASFRRHKAEGGGLPGQEERPAAHVHVEVAFGQRATELLQVVPGVLVQVRVLQENRALTQVHPLF